MIKGYPARKTPPESIVPAKKAIPCPRCQKPVEEWPDADTAGLGLNPDQVKVLGCGACRILAAHVEGIEDEWREIKTPEELSIIVQDAYDGLRQLRWIQDDEGFEPVLVVQ